MKILAPASGEPGLRVLDVVGAAAREFNRTLDIRLRFLDIGIDLIPVRPLRGQPAASPGIWRSRVRQVLEQEGPRLVLVVAGDPTARASAEEARERGVRTVLLVPPGREEERGALLEACPGIRAYDLGDLDAAETGRRLVEILVAERAGS